MRFKINKISKIDKIDKEHSDLSDYAWCWETERLPRIGEPSSLSIGDIITMDNGHNTKIYITSVEKFSDGTERVAGMEIGEHGYKRGPEFLQIGESYKRLSTVFTY